MKRFLIREKRTSGTRIFHIAPRRKGVKGERVLRRLPMIAVLFAAAASRRQQRGDGKVLQRGE